MNQTLIAIGALAITMLFALSSQRAEIRTDQQKIMAETQILAGQVALNVLDHINVQAFDEKVGASSASGLTAAALWTGGRDFDACTVVDHFHRMNTHRVESTGGLAFNVDARVRYVAADGTPSASQTYNKEVTVTVRDVPRTPSGEAVHIMPQPIELKRIVSRS